MADDVPMPLATASKKPETTKKRIIDSDDHNSEIRDPKKPRIDLNPELRTKVIKFIVKAHKKLLVLSKIQNAENNINVSCQVQNILFTCYTVKRQAANATRGTLETRISGIGFNVAHKGNNYPIDKDLAYNAVVESAIECGIPFEKHQMNSPGNWYGIASPLMNFLSGFDLRMSELRLGHHEMKVRKDKGDTLAFKVAQYGIYGCHHVLLEGVTFPPEKRTAMAQSLGPMTVILNLIKADPAYSAKWEIAAKRAFAHFPNIDSIIPMLKGKRSDEVRNLVHAIGDLALLTTTRQATRMFPPPCAFVKVFSDDETLIPKFNFSGKGAFLFYKRMCAVKWEMNGHMTDDQAKQICYHAMFGTYKEDLSILSQVTNCGAWFTREQFGKCMIKPNTCGNSVKFSPIAQIFYSKLCSANQTGLLSSNYSQISIQPVFSGKRKQKLRDDFFEYLREKRSNSTIEKSNYNLVQELRNTIEEITKKLEDSGKVMNMGTTSWYSVAGLTDEGGEREVPDAVFNASGVCFLGKN